MKQIITIFSSHRFYCLALVVFRRGLPFAHVFSHKSNSIGCLYSLQVFVSDNDIYWIESVERPNVIRVTSTGKEKILFNGIPDWVYEGKCLYSGIFYKVIIFYKVNKYLLLIRRVRMLSYTLCSHKR